MKIRKTKIGKPELTKSSKFCTFLIFFAALIFNIFNKNYKLLKIKPKIKAKKSMTK